MDILWWHWVVLGLFLILVELAAAGGFYVIFFGIAALLVGLLSSMHAAGSIGAQLILFSVLSVASLLLFRDALVQHFQGDPRATEIDQLVGEVAIVLEELPPGAVGKVELRGTTWSARTSTGALLPRGTRCRVTSVDGLTLSVAPEGAGQ
jgi:membrane protein implicated in regulation of membrane protease activity